MQIIKSNLKTLVNSETREPVRIGDKVKSFRGETCTVTGGTAPHKPASTGRVHVQEYSQEYFPSVFGLQWV